MKMSVLLVECYCRVWNRWQRNTWSVTDQELLTSRGFSIAGAWMEKFKQSTKKSIQHAKSLWSELYSYDPNK